MLLQATADLPSQIEAYSATWTLQVQSLQANNSQLESSNGELRASNDSLQISNGTLTQQNADLNNSLIASRADLAISEQERKRSERALLDSMQSTIRAQAEGRALELQLGLLRVGLYVSGGIAALLGGYVAGHAAGWW
jgi:hypothetical protein